MSPGDPEKSTVVVLTPGPFNSAYFEHSFLARSMGIELVEASDLFVSGDEVFVRTTAGPRRVHVIYRRTDDAYIDPEFFRPDSMLGVPGLMRAWAAGKVTLANAPGNGVADDKAIYPFVPDLIRYYLGEEPILEQVADQGLRAARRLRVRARAPRGDGGQGGRRGGRLRHADGTAVERRRARGVPRAHHRRSAPLHRAAPDRAVDLPDLGRRRAPSRAAAHRPAPLHPDRQTREKNSWVLPGGLTRVALRAGSYVVNSSQGGGSKDTWVQADRRVISRVADHCFWLGRYIERAESTARLLQVTRSLAFDAELPPLHCWRPLVIVSGQYPEFWPSTSAPRPPATARWCSAT